MSHQALILAGGRATRMGGADKGLVALSGRPLLAHALSALSAQLPAPARVWISANRNLEVYAGFGARCCKTRCRISPVHWPGCWRPCSGTTARFGW